MTTFWLGVTGFAVVLVSTGLMLALSALRRKSPPLFRTIPVFERLQDAVGRAVEDGSCLHVSLGNGGIVTPQSASALVGLSTLRRLADLTLASDQPPVATAGEASLAILSQATLQAANQTAAAGTPYDPTSGRLTGLTPFSYAAGLLPVVADENVSANVLLGSFGVEVGLLTDIAERRSVYTLAASDNLPAQAVIYASGTDFLIGEELYSAGAYLDAGPLHKSSLLVQDLLRWGIVLLLVVGAVLKIFQGLAAP
ncbi:MAG: hypothetical protein JXB85_01955 [Anaerolineales bacterium]|nr:hypothetical protein [Anaerolineales bacterium]